jgi:hypothetical protein
MSNLALGRLPCCCSLWRRPPLSPPALLLFRSSRRCHQQQPPQLLLSPPRWLVSIPKRRERILAFDDDAKNRSMIRSRLYEKGSTAVKRKSGIENDQDDEDEKLMVDIGKRTDDLALPGNALDDDGLPVGIHHPFWVEPGYRYANETVTHERYERTLNNPPCKRRDKEHDFWWYRHCLRNEGWSYSKCKHCNARKYGNEKNGRGDPWSYRTVRLLKCKESGVVTADPKDAWVFRRLMSEKKRR